MSPIHTWFAGLVVIAAALVAVLLLSARGSIEVLVILAGCWFLFGAWLIWRRKNP